MRQLKRPKNIGNNRVYLFQKTAIPTPRNCPLKEIEDFRRKFMLRHPFVTWQIGAFFKSEDFLDIC